MGVRPARVGGAITPSRQYADGPNLLQYASSRPTASADPLGLVGIQSDILWSIGQLAYCDATIEIVMSQDAEIQRILRLMRENKCPDPSPACVCCERNRPSISEPSSSRSELVTILHGYFDSQTKRAWVCANDPDLGAARERFRSTLIHEISHACHDCMDSLYKKLLGKYKNPCGAKVCTEMRATYAEGVCGGLPDDDGPNSQFRCVYHEVQQSVIRTGPDGRSDYGVCKDEAFFAAQVETLYRRCYNGEGECERKGP